MNRLVAILILIAGPCWGQRLVYLQIAITPEQYTNATTRSQVGAALIDFAMETDTPANRERWMTGWPNNYCRISDTNKTFHLVRVSALQAKRETLRRDGLRNSVKTRYKDLIRRPGVRVSINNTPGMTAKNIWGIKPKKRGGI